MSKSKINPYHNLFIFKDGASQAHIDQFIERVKEIHSADTMVFNKNERSLLIKNLNQKYHFRRNRNNLSTMVSSYMFTAVCFLECCPSHKLLVELYSRSETIELRRYPVEH